MHPSLHSLLSRSGFGMLLPVRMRLGKKNTSVWLEIRFFLMAISKCSGISVSGFAGVDTERGVGGKDVGSTYKMGRQSFISFTKKTGLKE